MVALYLPAKEISYTDGQETTCTEYEYAWNEHGNSTRYSKVYSVGDQIQQTQNYQHQYEYDAQGNLLRGHNYENNVIHFSYEYTYDSQGNKLRYAILLDEEVFVHTEWEYDAQRNLIKETDLSSGTSRKNTGMGE